MLARELLSKPDGFITATYGDEELVIEYARIDGTEEPPTTPSTSNILIGNNRVNKIYIGNTSISKVYLGDTRLL